MSRIVVTGIGIISAIGDSLESNRSSLQKKVCGISTVELFQTRYAAILPFGEIKYTNESLKQQLNVNTLNVTRTSLLAQHAFEQAIRDSALTAAEVSSFDTAFINATTVGGMCLTDELYRDANNQSDHSPYVTSYDLASVAIYLQELHNIQGICNTINTACSSSANAIMYGARLIKQGKAKRAIVGGTDSLAKFTINGFNALHILSPEKCKPFDQNRSGLNLGEAAAFLVLETEENCKGKKAYAVLSGYANANDAYHASALSDTGDGPYEAMKQALNVANLKASDISFVNAHGTGTENNDKAESFAMQRIFHTPPPFASSKSNTGHTLGAAAAIEAVYSILSITHQELYPEINFEVPIEETGLIPLQTFRQAPVKHVMSNSFGFAGNCSSLIFSSL
ncbi:beta-ketoacyl-[acyl-carrier-protein] synthase family protein [Cytophaga hutchinsonii]|uniref:3-oxoacyl-[acyl-carrier-protein] synthase II n=1 Tax=Cytophaga hutchinsonii (strain ATCC 33406 / DSM 1761 / CIP 103989 / NBRC 15051 / NCIMB 9469 / D465) TaxID=269798 RepID=A0A6N4SN17_CYTH3|nr:beta-ketoacyl-[acyl-carrier-protein] synthase family protein [Cytophaga hutchinsonii]ABG57674.1 3-oxoacyl-[acyl-carrier-protein] synthase II [Cytophaga hutchinsonii ATCC 33406]SFX02603.1 3-oxoacyl-(acyl-carrier-protein) synthase [Cytophaga hutchinsonii ATCC 33406]